MIKKVVLIIFLICSFNNVLAIDDQQIDDWGLWNTDFWAVWATDWWWMENSWDNNSNSSNWCSWPNCLSSTEFTIDTTDFTPTWKTINQWNLEDTTNNLLSTIIQNLMVAIWVIALLVMSIWSWYMIFYHGQDEMLSKWKTMFTTWITALIIALTSYYLVSLVRYILYN